MVKKSNQLLYIPSLAAITIDILLIVLSILIVIAVAPVSFAVFFQQYFDFGPFYFIGWLLASFLYKRYTGKIPESYQVNIQKLLWTILSVQAFIIALNFTPLVSGSSLKISISFSILLFSFGSIFYIIHYSIKNAIEYKDFIEIKKDKPDETKIITEQLDDTSFRVLLDSVIEYSSERAYRFIARYTDFSIKNNLITFSANYYDIKSKPDDKFVSVVAFNKLNNIRGINKLFSVVNQKLPMEGTFTCCFEPRSTRKKRIYDKYPQGINHLIYFFDYLTKRVIPKIFSLDKIYYDITKGKNRILSKTEVLGRLVYCGYDIVDVKKYDGISYVVAKKVKNLDVILEKRKYGALLTLKRIGKNGKMFKVYKFRTMFPYAEYLQAYVFKTYMLQKGGKINKDIRVNTVGKFMRKYWIDELPMFINVLRGEMKIVGVRPLSQLYYSLYTPELQQARIRYKPGLLPPFYADLPETLEQIQASEMRYLRSCKKYGVVITDLRYFVKILNNIVINKAKSA